MSKRVEQVTATVTLDGKDAQAQLRSLEARSKELASQMVKVGKANDLAGFKKLEQESKQVRSQIRQLKAESHSLDGTLKNLGGATLKQLQAAQRKLNTELSNTTRGTKEWIDKSKQLKLVSAEIRKTRNEMSSMTQSSNSFFSSLTNGFNKYFGLVTTFAASITGVVFSIKKAISAAQEYEQELAGLSSLTGLVGEDLEWLSERAKQASVSMLEGNVRVRASAEEILQAYTLVGSAKPELLANKEALAEVTEKAMILAEASGMKLPAAVEALTDTMNQFNAPAERAAEFMDALAAGSKYGAANIPNIAEAIVKFGVGANSANVSVQESVALIELLGEKGLKGAEAGTKLNGILNKLSGAKGLPKQAVDELARYGVNLDIISDKNLSLEERLREVAKISGDSAALIKVFGLENKNAAEALLTSLPRYEELTHQLQEVGVAAEQAAVNTNTQAAALDQARNKARLKAVELGEKLMPAQRISFNMFNKLMGSMIKFLEWTERNSKTLNTLAKIFLVLTASVVSYTAAKKILALIEKDANGQSVIGNKLLDIQQKLMKQGTATTHAYAAAKALLTGNVKGATTAFRAFTSALRLNPLTIGFTVIATAATALYAFKNRSKEAAESQEELSDAMKEVKAQGEEEIVVATRAFEALKKTNAGSEERKRLIDSINSQYGTTLQNLDDERAFLDQVSEAQGRVIDKIKEKIALQIQEAKYTEILRRQIQLEDLLSESQIRLEAMKRERLTTTDLTAFALKKLETEISLEEARIEGLKKSIQDQKGEIENLDTKTMSLLDSFSSPDDDDDGDDGGGSSKLDESIKLLEQYRQKLLDISADLERELLEAEARALFDVDRKYAKELEVASQFENERTEIGRQWMEVRKGLEEAKEEEILRIRQRFAEEREALAEKEREEDEKRRQAELDAEEAFRQKKRDLLIKYGIDAQALALEKELEELEEHYNNKLLSEEQFQIARAEIIRKHDEARRKELEESYRHQLSLQATYLDQAAQMTMHFSEMFRAMEETELRNAEDDEEKKAEIRKKYAVPRMLTLASETVINTATAVMKAFSELGPIGGAIAGAAILGKGAANFALQMQEIGNIKGYKDGLYPVTTQDGNYMVEYAGKPKTGPVDKPSLFVAGEEMPEMIIDGPTYKNIQMRFPEVLDAIQAARVPGYADGKYPDVPQYDFSKIESLMEKLYSALSSGIYAKLFYRDLEEFEQTIDAINSSTNRR